MKNYSIADSVFNVNLKYARMQNKTEELFFKCLYEGRSEEYFAKELEKIWGKSHKFFNEAVEEYSTMIHGRNLEGKTILREEPEGSIFSLVPISVVLGVEKKFKNYKKREYSRSLKSPAYEVDKVEYISKKIPRYNNQIVPYYYKGTNNICRYVELSTYNSMIYNTNLVREGWNRTLNDAQLTGERYFMIPYHPFSCEHCLPYQEKLLTRNEVIRIAGIAEEAEGDILHPNCKCEITIWKPTEPIPKSDLSYGEKEEIAITRQKVNSLTLKKERLLTDRKMQRLYGEQQEVDKLNQQIKKVNSKIKELQNTMPTDSLKKQVVAIYR